MNRRRYHEDEDLNYDALYKKRRRVVENQEFEDRIESLIRQVGEKEGTASLESNLEGLVSVLEADLATYRPKVLRILTDCSIKMPEKCTIYSTMIGLLNTKNYNFGGEFVENMVRHLKEFLKLAEFEKARFTLRFLSDLVNCHVVSASSLIHCYETLLDSLKEDGVPMSRKDWYVYAVLSCLPWVGRELYEKKEEALEKVLTIIEVYLNKRTKKHVPILRVWAVDHPHPQEEYLDCLWAQIQKLKQDMWDEKHILRPYLAFDNVLCEALQHNIPQILPASHQSHVKYPMPRVLFRMFDYTDCPEGPVMPGAHSIERFLIEEHLHQIIETHHFERKECASHLLNFPYKSKIPLEYCIIEVIFSELMTLPKPRYLEIVYGSILIELCKMSPDDIPPVLAQAIEMFFMRMEHMNVVCFDRFVNWFSYHLSNFRFAFSWQDWESCVNFNDEHPQPKFLRELFQKIMRLCYHQRVIEMVPSQFQKLLPEKPRAIFKYDLEYMETDDHTGVEIAQQLITAIREKATPERIKDMLREIPNPYGMDADVDMKVNPLMIDVFVQTVLFLSSKSISHSFTAMYKFYEVFKFLSEKEPAQLCILRSLFELWSTNQQVLQIIVDKLLKSHILECSVVANWIFSKEMSSEFTKMYVWEILCSTIHKMSRSVARITSKLQELKEQIGTVQTVDDNGEIKQVVIKSEDDKSNDKVDQLEEELELVQSNEKNLFLIIFQRFIMTLTEHFSNCEAAGVPYNNYWYKWITGRLQQVFLTHHEQVEKYSNTLETLIFTPDVDPHIIEIFQQFVSLRA